MIRDGVRLLWALENNDLSVLFEMFPHLKPQMAPTPAANGGGQLDEIKGLLEMIASQQKPPGGYLMQSKVPIAPALPLGEVKPVATDLDAVGNDFLAFIQ